MLTNYMNYAYELKAKFDAGLQLVGQEEDGSLMFEGSMNQWALADKLSGIEYIEHATYVEKRRTIHPRHEN